MWKFTKFRCCLNLMKKKYNQSVIDLMILKYINCGEKKKYFKYLKTFEQRR